MERLDIRPLTTADMPALEQLFAIERSAASCWGMWFITGMKESHASVGAADKALFEQSVGPSPLPAGLVARVEGSLVGLAAVGPRSRYARAVLTPATKGIGRSESDRVWLVPCLYTRPDLRNRGIAWALLEAAVALATKSGAVAIEGFPIRRPTGADRQVGTESLFRTCGFDVVARPSKNRSRMRRALAPAVRH